ncbi:hypothetical protein BU24DRAFT_477293 [Aaosphaeria arxii CBS 175.79]|uniref:Uncharacterized protein n=1 Tax=Aaosphaeria arxii CBS 175.79 TaxID=1450172 RepID=A0A6A5Y4L5_9PLEO|nr:uncharacterized protein BU24DRAFT_477293 [Aaosphaeria arxii CBS 175.79]KAF2020153.1 hypothetical protein BU24DRAFT_477293 [Aaosphaeria arxii CBS 175.79]
MGFNLPLPAPTDLSSTDNETHLRDDLATDVSARTDKSTYSIPEDGTPITINTVRKSGLHKRFSQTSLLIEYFEGGKAEGSHVSSRPSVRVRVTPSSRSKSQASNDNVHFSQTARHTRRPSYSRRISFGANSRVARPTSEAFYSEDSNVSFLPPAPLQLDLLDDNASDISDGSARGRYIPPMSDISSMPADSMLEGNPVIMSPGRRRSRSLEREEVFSEIAPSDTLKAPTRQRSRSLSKERITQRVMEKLQQKPVEAGSSKTSATKSSREELSASRKSRHRSKTLRDEELSGISGTDSSLLSSNVNRRSGDMSNRSALSGTSSSINNPKLLATVEDAIKRLILPELNALKEEQRTQKNYNKFDSTSSPSKYETVDPASPRDTLRRRVSKSSSAPHMHGNKPKLVLNRDGDDPGTVLSTGSSRRERRSSRGSTSDRSYAESTREGERVRHKKSRDKDGQSARDAALIGLGAAGLTAAALRHHDSRESKMEKKERRRRHSHSRSSRSRTASISGSLNEDELRVPPLPILQSELQGSEMTRDSILSAATETRERPSSSSSRDTGMETPLRDVRRGYASPSPRTPNRTPISLSRGLGMSHSNKSHGDVTGQTPKSDRSQSSRTKDPSSAGLSAAAAAKARALESTQPQVSQYEIADQSPTRALSPIQSEASYREEITTGSPRLRSIHSANSTSSIGRNIRHEASNASIASFESTPSTKVARTRKRPQGVNLERGSQILGSPKTPGDADEFFEQGHEQNDALRREIDNSSQGSPAIGYKHMSNYTDDSAEGQHLDSRDGKEVILTQEIRKVGSNPEYVHTPLAVESAVASLLGPSSISVRSSMASPIKKSGLSNVTAAYEDPYEEHIAREQELAREQEQSSKERWAAIREQGQVLAANNAAANSPRQSLARSSYEAPKMGASAFPTQDEMMPEIGFGVDDESDIVTNPSIVKGPVGPGTYQGRSQESFDQLDREATPSKHSYGKAAALGAGAGAAALGLAAAGKRNQSPSLRDDQYQDEYDQDYLGEQSYAPQPYYGQGDRTPTRSPMWKDEGYSSANQPGGITPDPRLRDRSKLFDDDGLGDFDADSLGDAGLFAPGGKHARHLSGNSHGMSSPLYDASTGKGLDNIQSKDVVALMDHLTVRDAQRNARDTEILVTLVRSAAEMRNQLEEVKQFIKTQDTMIMNQNDKRADLTEQRILGGPRPQPLGSPRVPRSSTEDINDVEQKKKSVFKRAIKGLGMKGDNDIKNIEKMLVQLLGEVEGLKHAHQLTLAQQATSQSLNSYENLRASGDPGYEPEGRAGTAGTASSPDQSTYVSNPSLRRIQDMSQGFEVHQPHRISTVEEDDEEYAEHDEPYENTERMTTPTQEARRNNSMSMDASPQAARAYRDSASLENTPKRKHKSNNSSIFGIPKISRWSKTTASTNPESLPRNSGGSNEQRPYSSASRSGSQINMAFYPEDQYEVQEDDRLRSNVSLARDEQRSIRSASPLIPEEEPQYVLDDPKYQAHRNSLNLQHPQPRQGPTGRHQNHLESQAQIYDPNPVRSPDSFDQWGSNPALARNRLSGGAPAGNLSPISSEGGYSQHSASDQAAPARPPKIRDDGPLIPQQPLAGHGQTRQMYSAQTDYGNGSPGALTPLAPIQEVRYSLETDTGHHYSPSPSPRPNSMGLNPASAMSPQRKITGPRPMGSRSPSGQQGLSGQAQLQHSDTVIRRKPVADYDNESLKSYRSSLDSEIF